MRKTAVSFSLFVLLSCFTNLSEAYTAINVRNGGTIQGVVRYTGAVVPEDPLVTLTSETEYCGKSMPAGQYLITDNKIQNVVVSLDSVTSGKPVPHRRLVVKNEKCRFDPRIAIAFKGSDIVMQNDDPVLHTFDIHATVNGRELYHVALHEKGSSVTKKIQTAGLLELTCYIHPWQRAYIAVFDHPYAAVTGKDGTFSITDIPPGTYTVTAWHEALGSRKIADVRVEGGKTNTVTIEYTGK